MRFQSELQISNGSRINSEFIQRCARNASVSTGGFSGGNYACETRKRNVDFLESETFPSIPIACSTRSWRASRLHPFFRVAIPRVNFTRWQPFSIAECGNLPLPFGENDTRAVGFSLFSIAPSVATNSGGLYRIGPIYTAISTACNTGMRSIIELGVMWVHWKDNLLW